MKKHLIACSLLALFAATGAHAADKLRMGIVVKIGGYSMVQRHGSGHQE